MYVKAIQCHFVLLPMFLHLFLIHRYMEDAQSWEMGYKKRGLDFKAWEFRFHDIWSCCLEKCNSND